MNTQCLNCGTSSNGLYCGRMCALEFQDKNPVQVKDRHKGRLDSIKTRLTNPMWRIRDASMEEFISRFSLSAYMKTNDGTRKELCSPLARIGLLLTAKSSPIYTIAATQIEYMAIALSRGCSPEELDLRYDGGKNGFRQLLSQLILSGGAIPLELFEQTTPHDRAYGEALLVVQIEKNYFRSPAILAELKAYWTIPVMRELSTSSTIHPYMVRELKKALPILESNLWK